jgi:hypothetical protein
MGVGLLGLGFGFGWKMGLLGSGWMMGFVNSEGASHFAGCVCGGDWVGVGVEPCWVSFFSSFFLWMRSIHTSLGQMAAAKATLPVHLRHGMQWQTVSYADSPTWRYLMAPQRQAPVRSGGDVVAGVLMMMSCVLLLL